MEKYCELADSLAVQLKMFQANYEIWSLADAQHTFKTMVPAVEQLIRFWQYLIFFKV